MLTLPIIFCSFIIFVVTQRIYETYSLPKRASGQVSYSWSLVAMTVLHVLMIFGSFVEFFYRRGAMNVSYPNSVAGLCLYFAGLGLRNWSKRTLSKHWSLQIEIQKDHKIERMGPFKYVRHGAYSAIIMEIIGIPLVANAYWTLWFVSIPYVVLIWWRSRVEEKALINATGWEYIKFQREVAAFLPFRFGIECFDRRVNSDFESIEIERRKGERRRKKEELDFVDKRKMVKIKK